MANDYVSWGGVACSACSILLYAVSRAQGERARQLDRVTPIGSLSELHAVKNMLPMMVAITGMASSQEPIRCQLSDREAVIREVVETQIQKKLRENTENDWVRQSEVIRRSTEEASTWGLEDGSGVFVPVVGAMRAHPTLLLVGEVFRETDQRKAFVKVLDTLKGIRNIGIKTTESILPVGQQLTCVGELAPIAMGAGLLGSASDAPAGTEPAPMFRGPTPVTIDGRMVALRPPELNGQPHFVTTRTLNGLKAGLLRSANAHKWAAIGVAAVGGLLIARKLIKTVGTILHDRRMARREEIERAKIERRRRANAAAAAAEGRDIRAASASGAGSSSPSDSSQREADLCVVCLDQQCTGVFVECGHMCVCHECAARLNSCPVCRKRGRVMRVFRT